MSNKHRLLFISFLITACRSAAPPGMPGPGPRSGDSPANPPELKHEITSWTIFPVAQEHHYTSVTTAVLESTGFSGASRDTVLSTIDFSLFIERNVVPASYSATIAAVSIRGGPRTAGSTLSPTNLSLPFIFTGRIEANRITLDLPKLHTETPASCSSEILSAIPVIQRSLVLVPLQLRTGMAWTDSTRTSVCSGPLMVLLTSVRTYQVRGQTIARSRPVILLEQQNRTSFTGDGTQEQHRIHVRGEGSGKAQLMVDAVSGDLIDTTSDHTTVLIVTSSGRDQRFTQTSRESVTRADL